MAIRLSESGEATIRIAESSDLVAGELSEIRSYRRS
jgi:hypothetical protein